jgi:hypothetical protein
LLDYDVTSEEIGAASLVMAGILFPLPLVLFFTGLPIFFKVMALAVPFGAMFYILKYPSLKADQKLVEASEDLILSILYMVVYLRSSPNMEGAVTFAARHLDGPVAIDLRAILWELDVRKYSTIEEAMESYMQRWRPYNKGFVESLSLIKSAIQAPNAQKRSELLTESIDTLLNHTRRQMNRFARGMKMPVMVLHGIGILLPVLGIILFPLISNFLGGGLMVYYLVFIYNILLPTLVYVFMKNLLTKRPMSFSSRSGQIGERPGSIQMEVAGRELSFNAFYLSVPLFVAMMAWPGIHYINIMGAGTFPISPSIGTLFREMFILVAFAVPVGVHLIWGYKHIIEKQEEVKEIETEFPKALFELGNALDKGQPIERAVETASQGARELSIARFFDIVSSNIRRYGLTFRQALFDPKMGAITRYPSKLITTIMEIVSEATQKGSRTAAKSVLSISKYLKNIQETQEVLEELMDDTMSSLKFLAYILSPLISGVAVGMGTVISQAFHAIGNVFDSTSANASANATAGGAGAAPAPAGFGGGGGLGGLLNTQTAIPPGVMQLVVGIYIIQLAFLVGSLFVNLEEGDNMAKKRVTMGKILMSSILLYVITVMIVAGVFGGIIASIESL